MRLSARASGSSCGAAVVYPLEAPPTQPAMPARTQYRPICHAYQQLLAQVCLAEIVQIKRVLLLVDQPCAATVEKRTCGFPNSRWRLKSFQQSAATASRAKTYFVSQRHLQYSIYYIYYIFIAHGKSATGASSSGSESSAECHDQCRSACHHGVAHLAEYHA